MSAPFDAAPIPLQAQIACVKRELLMRSTVYPRRVMKGAMRQRDATAEMDAMRAVLATLEGLQRARAPTP